MNLRLYYAREEFQLTYPMRGAEIVKETCLDDSDILYELSDGRRVIFNDLYHYNFSLVDHPDGRLTEEEYDREFIRKVKNKAQAKGLTQKDIANAVGVSDMLISRILTGKKIPDMHIIHKLCDLFNCSIGELTDFSYLI